MALVRKIRRVSHKGKVHDLCVENTHTYNIEGIAVHNSAGGSLVSYCLELTDIDPIKHDLIFERFLDPSRSDPPDIDTDFDPRIRDWVKEHIVETFGEKQTCSIGTYQTYKTRAVILDVARASGLDVGEAMQVTKKLEGKFDVENDEGEVDEQGIDKMSFEELRKHFPELDFYFEQHPEVLYHAEILRDQVKNMGKHAGGMIISNLDLQDMVPVSRDKSGQVISSWSEGLATHELSEVGLVKFDILGLNNLSVISDCINFIRDTTNFDLKKSDIPIDDKESIMLGSKGEMIGIFQFENPSTKPVSDEVKMESLADISAVTSLIRPGPRGMGMDMEYAERKNGKEYDMPDFIRNELSDTYGVIVYQEQVIRIAQVVAGFSLVEGGRLRKVVSKKKLEEMAEMRDMFIDGAQPRIDAGEITREEVEKIWELLESFGGYGFNRAHATAYSAISAVEFWLKFHFPVQYVAALANNTALGKKKHGSDNVVIDYLNYARRHGIEVLPPDINQSGEKFRIEGKKTKSIRFALGHIKRVGTSAGEIEKLQPFDSLEDFFNRVNKRKVNKGVMKNLIASGAFNSFGTRQEVLDEFHLLRKNKKDELEDFSEDAWVDIEREVTGMCLSRPPIVKEYTDLIKKRRFITLDDFKKKRSGVVFGRIDKIESKTSKKGTPMYIVKMSDDMDTINFFVFDRSKHVFAKSVKAGYVAGIPLSKFEDGDACYFDSNKECEVIKT